MYQFIIVLRALAAIIITNAHYEEIYPVSIIANGGLLGDVIFFAVSGFCLCSIKTSFAKWYGKRILRIYPAVWMITIVYIICGFYSADTVKGVLGLLVYPTYYHFVASIIVLYVVYYAIMKFVAIVKVDKIKILKIIFGSVAGIQCLIYIFLYDKSYYHIDSVYEPMIRFLFLEAMLIGAIIHEKINKGKIELRNQYMWGGLGTFILYFGLKMALTKYSFVVPYQIFNQVILLLLLYFIFMLAAGFEGKIKEIPGKIYICLRYISRITLEIYLVQYALIPRLNIAKFPINFIFVSFGILLAATILHLVVNKLQVLIENFIKLNAKKVE